MHEEKDANLHKMSQLIVRLERNVQDMYGDPRAVTNEEFFKAAQALEAKVAKASEVLTDRRTELLQQNAGEFQESLNFLEEKIAKVEAALRMIDAGAASVQAITELLNPLHQIFGI